MAGGGGAGADLLQLRGFFKAPDEPPRPLEGVPERAASAGSLGASARPAVLHGGAAAAELVRCQLVEQYKLGVVRAHGGGVVVAVLVAEGRRFGEAARHLVLDECAKQRVLDRREPRQCVRRLDGGPRENVTQPEECTC